MTRGDAVDLDVVHREPAQIQGEADEPAESVGGQHGPSGEATGFGSDIQADRVVHHIDAGVGECREEVVDSMCHGGEGGHPRRAMQATRNSLDAGRIRRRIAASLRMRRCSPCGRRTARVLGLTRESAGRWSASRPPSSLDCGACVTRDASSYPQWGVGASLRRSPSTFSSVQKAAGISASKLAWFCSISSGERAPGISVATFGWPRGNWSAAVASRTP